MTIEWVAKPVHRPFKEGQHRGAIRAYRLLDDRTVLPAGRILTIQLMEGVATAWVETLDGTPLALSRPHQMVIEAIRDDEGVPWINDFDHVGTVIHPRRGARPTWAVHYYAHPLPY